MVHPFIVAGAKRYGSSTQPVVNPFDRSTFAEVASARPQDVEEALAASARGFEAVRAMPAWKRSELLFETARRLVAARESFARTIALEAGKPITLARQEVDRAVITLRTSAEEATRIGGEVLPLDHGPGLEGRFGLTRRFPIGPVACITPFNFPLNLVAHKIAPALSAGCSVIVKPASRTPLSALGLASMLLDVGFPPEAISVLPLSGAASTPLVEDPRIRALSFTGSAAVGWDLRRQAFRKKVVLELGGNAGLIVDRTADLDLAATKTAAGGFAYAGQSCISVQRIYAHEEIFRPFLDRLLDRVGKLVVGDPLDEGTTVGPMISQEDAARVEEWIAEAIAGGAKILIGGKREGSLVQPTVLTGTLPSMRVCEREAFAPLVVVEPFQTFREAIAAVDRSEFGLQAGLFTRDLGNAIAAFLGIEVGALIVNDTPTFRSDPMPYGGVKSSGMGREGPRYAIEDYTELRLLVVSQG